MIRFVQFSTPDGQDQREIGARLGSLFKGEIDVAVSSKGFVFRRIGINKTLKCEDLTHALAFKIRKIVHELEHLQKGEPADEKLNQLSEAKSLLTKVISLGSDVEATDRPYRIKKALGHGMTKAVGGIFEAKSKAIKGVIHFATSVDQHLLEVHHKHKGESSPAVMKANRSLRKALESNDPYGDSFEALYNRYQNMYLRDTRQQIDALLVKKNSALSLCFTFIGNMFKGKAGEEIQSNSLLRTALENRKIEDANFIISKHLYRNVDTSLLEKFSAIPWMSEGDKEKMLENMFHSALKANPLDGKGAEVLLEYLFANGRADLAKQLILNKLDDPDASSEALNACRLASAKNGEPGLIQAAFNPSILESYKDWTDPQSGKTLLHYACQSNNGEFVKQVVGAIDGNPRELFLKV